MQLKSRFRGYCGMLQKLHCDCTHLLIALRFLLWSGHCILRPISTKFIYAAPSIDRGVFASRRCSSHTAHHMTAWLPRVSLLRLHFPFCMKIFSKLSSVRAVFFSPGYSTATCKGAVDSIAAWPARRFSRGRRLAAILGSRSDYFNKCKNHSLTLLWSS